MTFTQNYYAREADGFSSLLRYTKYLIQVLKISYRISNLALENIYWSKIADKIVYYILSIENYLKVDD